MLKLRKAKDEEEQAIFNLVETVLAEYGISTNARETDKDLSDLNKYYFDRKGWFGVLVEDDRIIGSYGIYQVNERTCELRKMYLLPEFHGRGFGKQMMEAAIGKAAELGYEEMILESNQLLDRALHLYKKYGFMEYQPEHFSDRCDLAMKLNLNDRLQK